MRFISTLFVAWLVCCAGCSERDGLVPVKGVITLDGTPMPSIQVLFDQPELGANENKGYTGKTDEQGRYTLRPMLGEGAGTPPGTFRVSLSTAADPLAAAPKPGVKQTAVFYPEGPPPPPKRSSARLPRRQTIVGDSRRRQNRRQLRTQEPVGDCSHGRTPRHF